MLQQTRVETVLAYYEPFLQRFPDIPSLARASHDEVLKHWEGLGYYRRILHLHEAARVLDGRNRPVPDSVAELRELPGVGEYTAAAIASIAFGLPAAAVDGNVVRVVSRLCGLRDAAGGMSHRKQVQAIAQSLLPRSRPGEFNQAWMDLGSAVCVPGEPRCTQCPLREHCATACDASVGRRRDRTRRAIPRPTIVMLVGVFRRQDRYLVRQRARGGLWSGLWEFPTVPITATDDRAEGISDLARAEGLSLQRPKRFLGELRHDLTHRRIVFRVYAARVNGAAPRRARRPRCLCGPESTAMRVDSPAPLPGHPACDGLARRWVTPEELIALPVSTAHRRISAKAQVGPVMTPGDVARNRPHE